MSDYQRHQIVRVALDKDLGSRRLPDGVGRIELMPGDRNMRGELVRYYQVRMTAGYCLPVVIESELSPYEGRQVEFLPSNAVPAYQEWLATL